MIVFRYKEESLGLGKGTVLRPVADVFLQSSAGAWIEFHPYIDSGADVTMVPLSLGKLLGLHVRDDHVEQIGGICGSVPVVYGKAIMRIGAEEFPVKIAWALIEDVPPLLGRADVFEAFDITFQQQKRTVLFQKHS